MMLHSPPLTRRTNKILWVSKVAPTRASPLRIRATLASTGQTAVMEVTGGPGPSIIDLPSAGCWSFSLRWAWTKDHLDLRYVAG